jgi:3-methyladenine DNA glycosylase AlkD
MTPAQFARLARAALRKAARPTVARRQRMFFKPWEKVWLYGIKTPALRTIERRLYQVVRKEWRCAEAVEFCELLIARRQIESKGLALMLLARYHRQYEEDLLDRAKRWLERDLCDNWAVTDQLSTQILSRLLDKFEPLAATVESWSRSPNLWVRRASVVSFVKPAGKGRQLDRVYGIVTALLTDGHDLMHKASGWLLREAGKADVKRLEQYLLEYGPAIPRTTVRYAIERFPEAKRRRILELTRAKERDVRKVGDQR